MRRVPIPCDLKKIKPKVMFNLTKRQLICFSIGGALGIPIFFLAKNVVSTSTAVLLMMVVMLPAFFLAMYEKYDQPCEVLVKNYIHARFIRPKIRPNRSINLYTYLEVQDDLEQEVNRIVWQAKERQKATLSQGHPPDERGKEAI